MASSPPPPPAPTTRRPKREPTEHSMLTRAGYAIKKQKEEEKLNEAYEQLQIHSLICKRRWSAVLRKVQRTPIVVCISSETSGGGCHTVLHSLFTPSESNLRYPFLDDEDTTSSEDEEGFEDNHGDDDDDDDDDDDEDELESVPEQREGKQQQQVQHQQHQERRKEREVPVIPVIKAILNAADIMGYGGTKKGDVAGGADKTLQYFCGSWNLLSDQNNPNRQSPLHMLLLYNTEQDKVAIMKALLLMDGDESNHRNIQRQQLLRERRNEILSLLDSKERNVLHYCLLADDEGVITDEYFEAIRFLVHHCPTLLHQRNKYGIIPLDNIFQQLRGWSICYDNIEDEDEYGAMSMFAKKQSYYRVLKLFVHGMLGRSGTDMTLSTDNEEEIKGEMKGKFDTPTTDINSTSKSRVGSIDNLSQNVLHEACLLPRSILLPSDYRVFADNPISYLLCNDASRLEAAARQSKGSINMADEEDASGNFALHLFVSNESYCIVKKLRDINFEEYLLKQLIEYNPSAVFIPNKDHKLPLHLAMKAGRRHAVTKLLTLHPDAVHLDDRMDDPQIFVQLLGCVADVARERNEARASYFSSMFQLIRSRPDICAAGVDWSRRNNARRGRST